MARTGAFIFKSHGHSNCIFIIPGDLNRGLCFLDCPGLSAWSQFCCRDKFGTSRSDDHSSPDSNSVQHTVFLHLLQSQPVPDLTCSAKWRILSEKRYSLWKTRNIVQIITDLYLAKLLFSPPYGS